MAQSLKFTNVAAYQAYVQKYHNQLYTRLTISNKTAMYTRNFEGVKGKITLTELVAGDLYRRWRAQHDPVVDAIDFKPRTLDTVRAKIDLDFIPSELEENYLGELRRTGQDPKDFPIQAFVLQSVFDKAAQEREIAMWQGVATGAPVHTDKLVALFNGYLKLIADEITATNLTPYTSGALTTTNILGHVENMWGQMGDAYKEGRVNVFMSWGNYQKFVTNYRNDIGKYTNPDMRKEIHLDWGNCVVIPIPGMQTSNRIVMTAAGNLLYGYDANNDAKLMRMFENKRVIEAQSDIRIGVQMALLDDASAAIVVNDQA